MKDPNATTDAVKYVLAVYTTKYKIQNIESERVYELLFQAVLKHMQLFWALLDAKVLASNIVRFLNLQQQAAAAAEMASRKGIIFDEDEEDEGEFTGGTEFTSLPKLVMAFMVPNAPQMFHKEMQETIRKNILVPEFMGHVMSQLRVPACRQQWDNICRTAKERERRMNRTYVKSLINKRFKGISKASYRPTDTVPRR